MVPTTKGSQAYDHSAPAPQFCDILCARRENLTSAPLYVLQANPNSLDVFHLPDPAVKKQGHLSQSCRHALSPPRSSAAVTETAKLHHSVFFHCPARKTEHPLNIMVKNITKTHKISSHFTVIIIYFQRIWSQHSIMSFSFSWDTGKMLTE